MRAPITSLLKAAPPAWVRVALLGLAAGLVAIVAASAPGHLADSWGWTASFQGQLGPNETARHTFSIGLPAGHEQGGVRFQPRDAALTLVSRDALDASPYRVTLFDARGVVVQDRFLDPGNPLAAPHGPPRAVLPSGTYMLRVAAPPNATLGYAFEAQVRFPFTAQPTALTVEAAPLLVGAAGAAGLALVPRRNDPSIARAPPPAEDPRSRDPPG